MSLAAEKIQQFRTQGFTLVDGFFNAAEVAAMQAEIARFQREGLLRNVATAGDGTTPSTQQRNLQLCPIYEHSPLFRSLPFCSKVLTAIGQLIGDPLVLQLDQVFLKPAGDGMGTGWHQDNAYFKIADATKGTAMWIAVHDATVANGTLHVAPGCFDRPLPHERDPNSDHHIHCVPPTDEAIPLELKAGGVGFFCYGTPHCTKGNTTDADRAAAAYHFVNADHATADLVEEGRKYHPYLTGPKASGGQNEYGVRVVDDWAELTA